MAKYEALQKKQETENSQATKDEIYIVRHAWLENENKIRENRLKMIAKEQKQIQEEITVQT